MSDKAGKKLKLPHWLPFVSMLVGVFALMILYVVFIAKSFGETGSPQENFADFVEYINTRAGDIEELSRLEFSKLEPGDTKGYFITDKGDETELRGKVFESSYMGQTSMSAVTGTRIAVYYFMWYDIDCVVIFDEGNAEKHSDGSGLSAVITDSITAAVNGHQKE